MIGTPAEKTYSKSSGPMVMVMLQWVTSLVCILQEKVENGLTAVRLHAERVAVLALLTMNVVSIHVKSGTAVMDQSSRYMLEENSWEKPSLTMTTSCYSTSKVKIGFAHMLLITMPLVQVPPGPLLTASLIPVLVKYIRFGRDINL